jgi:peptidyl-prolyl cis-trans isomerase B (cyclophilin B)
MGIVGGLVAALVVAGVILLGTGVLGGGKNDPGTAASGSSSAPASDAAASPSAGGPCGYTAADTKQNPDLTEVSVPSADVPTTGSQKLTMSTNFGDIGLTLDQANAPCASGALVHLARQKFFDGTDCHRETNSPGLQVLQCGDPSGTGRGGAAFNYPTQVTGKETYPRGTIAMANSGQGFDGSQFFLVYGDSLDNNPNYTVVGKIDNAGLAVLDRIAKAGIEGGGADGAPAKPVTIEKMSVG